MMRKFSLATLLLALAAVQAGAQSTGPRPLELGIDAGVSIGLDDDSFTMIDIPVQAFRIGFPVSPRISLEPKLRINVLTGEGDTFSTYRGELGLLYHLGSDRYPGAYHRAGLYLRPFVGIVGFSNGDSDSAGLLGAGVGYKMPLVSRLSSRFEANFAHYFGDGDANELGLLAGLSFFTR
jgi:hypothetical protein